MRIFHKIWCSYSNPSNILIQMTYIAYIVEIHWKQLNLSSEHQKSTEIQLKLTSGHQTLTTEHPGSLRKA